MWRRPSGFADGALKHGLKAGDVGGEAIACIHQPAAVFAEQFSFGFVLEEVIESGGEGIAIHPGNEVAVESLFEPVLDATGIECDDGQRIAHDFETDGGDGLRPHAAESDDAAFAVVGLEFLLRNEAFEMYTVSEAELAAEFFAIGPVIAVAENDAFKFRLHAGERFEQDVHTFATDDLTGVEDEIAIAEGAAQMGISHAGRGRMEFDAGGIEAVAEEFIAHVFGDHRHAMKAAIESDLAFLGAVADPFEREAAAVVFNDTGTAADDAVE